MYKRFMEGGGVVVLYKASDTEGRLVDLKGCQRLNSRQIITVVSFVQNMAEGRSAAPLGYVI
jgi:hypothetical protein